MAPWPCCAPAAAASTTPSDVVVRVRAIEAMVVRTGRMRSFSSGTGTGATKHPAEVPEASCQRRQFRIAPCGWRHWWICRMAGTRGSLGGPTAACRLMDSCYRWLGVWPRIAVGVGFWSLLSFGLRWWHYFVSGVIPTFRLCAANLASSRFRPRPTRFPDGRQHNSLRPTHRHRARVAPRPPAPARRLPSRLSRHRRGPLGDRTFVQRPLSREYESSEASRQPKVWAIRLTHSFCRPCRVAPGSITVQLPPACDAGGAE